MKKWNNYIDGGWQPAIDGETISNIGPADGQVLGKIPRSKQADVDCAVSAASRALKGQWSCVSRAQRADYLDAIACGIEDRLVEFAETESMDQGKPISLAKSIDIPRAVANFRFFAGLLRHHTDAAQPMDDALNYTHRKPVGVIGLITPWNLPLYLLSWKTAPALAMGNAVVAKPSEMTPLTATLLAEVIHQAGLPKGVFNLVHGLGPEVGHAIVAHPDTRAISFTGGTATGRIVAATAAPLFKKISLELGGKNPTIIFADCDIDKAVDGAVRAAFTNQGEICLCGSRILIEDAIYAQFMHQFTEKVNQLKVGNPKDPSTGVGALVSAAHRDKVASYIALGKKEGGRVLCGGDVPNLPPSLKGGNYLMPTVIDGLPSDSRTATEEIFGPVVTTHKFTTEAECLMMANEVEYGLAASVWTRDIQRAHRVSHALDTGMVWINCWLKRDLRAPFGGMKHSGVGREGGKWSLEFYSEARNICVAYS